MAAPLPLGRRMDLLWKDIRFSIRSLRANPGFALVSILTLALGIGATTAIFSVVNGVLLQPLPLHEPSRLVVVAERDMVGPPNDYRVTSPMNYLEWVKETRLFSSMGAYFDWEMNLTGRGEPELVRVGLSTGSLFKTLGARPFIGRVIENDTDPHIVLSYDFWQSKFGGDRGVIGKPIQLEGDTMTIVGVMPRDFFVPGSRAVLWAPYPPPNSRGRYLTPIARLAPGVTEEQARAGMIVVAKRLELAFPERNANWTAIVVPIHEHVVGNVRRALLIVMAAVAFLLLIACVNIANLLLSRATGRRKEMAIRAAVGASRGQLIRQLLTESLILAIIAGIVGVVIAGWATMILVRFTPESALIPRTAEIAVDESVLGVSVLITLATGVLFGLAPAIGASRANLQGGLTSATRGSSEDRTRKTFRNTLIVAEVALATVLLIGAGLLIKSFAKLEQVSPGVNADGVLTMRIVLPGAYNNNEQRRVTMTEVLTRIDQLPGVENVGAIGNMPFTNALSRDTVAIEGEEPRPEGQELAVDIRAVAGDYFRAMGMSILAGRVFEVPDRGTGPVEFIVNDAFVRRYFPGQNIVGKRIVFNWFDGEFKGPIVGVVGSVRAAGLETEPATALYISYLNDRNVQFTLAIRTSTPPMSLQTPVTRVLRSINPIMPIKDVKPLEDLISGTIARPRFNATMLSIFAVLGLILASIGIYGVLSYSVAQRTHEMGIRMALGADPRDVLRLVVRDGMTVTILGICIGLVIAVPATRTMAALLYGVDTFDLQVFAAVAVTLTLVALLASFIPARRATRVHPMIALRAE
jgi:putative ABC transport system permease protein